MASVPSDWLKFSTRTFTKGSQNEFRKRYNELLRKEIEGPEALEYAEFSTLHDGLLLQNVDQFCHVSYRHEDRIFTSQAWNRLFRIQQQEVREYMMGFLSSFTFNDHVVELDIVDTMVFQLGGVKRSMSMSQFILALGLYLPEEMNNNLFEPFREMVDVPWNVAKFLSDKSKGYKKKSLIVAAHLIGRIARSYELMAPAYMRIVTLG
uniref:Uncharacterized protein n=1 Tax=Tanacetum cinerariifolium TaxID=118510 RepID=A0A6L2KXG9_TANCI|nr:hypothetical protein [Tanacetum cinerariifolium]